MGWPYDICIIKRPIRNSGIGRSVIEDLIHYENNCRMTSCSEVCQMGPKNFSGVAMLKRSREVNQNKYIPDCLSSACSATARTCCVRTSVRHTVKTLNATNASSSPCSFLMVSCFQNKKYARNFFR